MPMFTTKLRPFFASMFIALSAMEPHLGSAATWADPSKVLRVALPSDITGLDPAATQDLYSNAVEARIFDALYVWDYLERPYRFVPSLALGMPEISSDGRTWTIRLRQGIFFDDDPAFAGKRRELTAGDFVYSWKRLVDPRLRSPSGQPDIS
jgi:ABC-type transport system substrate-binding protein